MNRQDIARQDLARRVLDVAEQNELLRQHSRDLAQLRGDVALLLARTSKTPRHADDSVLEALVAAAFGAMRVRVWTVAELLSRTLAADRAGLNLDAAIRATGREGARSLGQFLARLVPPGEPYQTAGGLELRRYGESSDRVLLYVISRV